MQDLTIRLDDGCYCSGWGSHPWGRRLTFSDATLRRQVREHLAAGGHVRIDGCPPAGSSAGAGHTGETHRYVHRWGYAYILRTEGWSRTTWAYRASPAYAEVQAAHAAWLARQTEVR